MSKYCHKECGARERGRYYLVAIILAPALFLAEGCGGFWLGTLTEYKIDRSNKDKYWGGYESGATYVLVQDVWLVEHEDWSKRLVLTPISQPGEKRPGLMRYGSHEWTREQYERDPAAFPMIRGIVSQGTRIRVTRVFEHGALVWGSGIFLFGEVLDGSHKGTEIDVTDLSMLGEELKDGPYLLKPDPRLLRPVPDPAS
ncbi:MAG: hypothetical protein HY706_21390 [Candidatus Hydrogenedentes bacterium]|nr:hypothetical protein [Candidatus Hydrogenedentota bacterium]